MAVDHQLPVAPLDDYDTCKIGALAYIAVFMIFTLDRNNTFTSIVKRNIVYPGRRLQ